MRVRIRAGKAEGSILAPPSKSMAHRMLIGAGLAEGGSIIENISFSDDIQATLSILANMGAQYKIKGRTVMMTGIGGKEYRTDQIYDCRESGSTLRFFLPILLVQDGFYRLTGAKRLLERPLGVYEDICVAQKIRFERSERHLTLSGQLTGGTYEVPGDISSQFITGLLYALPLMDNDSTLHVLPPVESRAYIELTLDALAHFGIRIERKGDTFFIPGNQHYIAKDATVEGDYSNAAFLDAFSLLGGRVSVRGLSEDSRQGDRIYRDYYRALQAGTPTLDLSDCPDLGPVLMGLAATLYGARFTGTKRLRIKESDRAAVMAEELKKFGIDVIVGENDVIVKKGVLKSPNETLKSHNDHRIAMTMALLASRTGGVIEEAEAVRKSYPEFFRDIKKLGIDVQEEES